MDMNNNTTSATSTTSTSPSLPLAFMIPNNSDRACSKSPSKFSCTFFYQWLVEFFIHHYNMIIEYVWQIDVCKTLSSILLLSLIFFPWLTEIYSSQKEWSVLWSRNVASCLAVLQTQTDNTKEKVSVKPLARAITHSSSFTYRV